MKIVGVDPHASRPYGWALIELQFKGSPLLRVVDYGDAEFERMVRIANGADETVIEDPYLYRNFKTAKELIRSAANLEGALRYERFTKVVWMNPATWQATVIGRAARGKEARERVMRLQAEDLTKQFVKQKDLTDDEVDAILIAYVRAMEVYSQYRQT